tara:strand:- start:481 stop:591 length:111 start_codon:yes stop_codon:yes gene_type:complete
MEINLEINFSIVAVSLVAVKERKLTEHVTMDKMMVI